MPSPCHTTSLAINGQLLWYQLRVPPRPLPHFPVREVDGAVQVYARCNPAPYIEMTARDGRALHLAGPGAGILITECEARERTAAMAGLTGWHVVILIAVVVLLVGAKRLPDMARAVGQSARIFKHEIKHDATADQSHQRSIADRTHPPTS